MFIASSYERINKPKEAKQVYEEILKEDKDSKQALNNLSILEAKYGNNYAALRYVNKLITLDPDNIQVMNNKAMLLVEIGDIINGVKVLEKIISNNKIKKSALPANIERNYVRCLYSYDKVRAIKLMEEKIEKSTDASSTDDYKLILANHYKSENNLEKALQLVESCKVQNETVKESIVSLNELLSNNINNANSSNKMKSDDGLKKEETTNKDEQTKFELPEIKLKKDDSSRCPEEVVSVSNKIVEADDGLTNKVEVTIKISNKNINNDGTHILPAMKKSDTV